MKISNKFYSLSFFLLLIIAINGVVQTTSISPLLKGSVLTELNSSNVAKSSSVSPPRFEEGVQVVSGGVTLTTDKKSYVPGERVTITAEGDTDTVNGSLEWQLETPKLDETPFDFQSYYQDIFADPTFDDSSYPHPDWKNYSYYQTETNLGYMNLTQITDNDTEDALVVFNKTKLDITTALNPEEYIISFDYYSQGINMFSNPSFESGDLTNWYGLTDNITVVSSVENASDGIYYADINASEGIILWQNFTVIAGQVVSFTARATGSTNSNYWKLRIEAYNDTEPNVIQTIKDSVDSRSLTPDEKGYIFNAITRWTIPQNTSYIRVIFIGSDEGDDSLYTGWLDDCILSKVSENLIFQYWGESKTFENKTISAGEHIWKNFVQNIKIDKDNPSNKLFAFTLPDTNSFRSNVTSYWLIDNITINYVTVPSKSTQIIEGEKFSGSVKSTWFHRGFRENLTSNFTIDTEERENTSVPADCTITIKIQLPEHQIYFGSWHFIFQIHRIVESGEDTKTVIISFTVEETMNFIIQSTYILRGSTNESISEEEYNYTEYFEQENNIEAISPGDNITILGYLEANSTPTEWYHLDYLDISDVSTYYFWNSTADTMENIDWYVNNYIKYNSEGETLLDGNFTYPYNNTITTALNFQVPIRGIYGNLSSNLTFSIQSSNVKDTGLGFPDIEITIPIELPIVKFYVEITEEKLPENSYYLTEYISGNITVEFTNYNNTLETSFPDRNISSLIDIPMKDIDLTIFLDDLSHTPSKVEILLKMHYNFINKTFLWLDPINPNILPGEYAFLIRWDSPYELEIENQAYLDITDLNITVQGTLEIIQSEESVEIQQGELATLNFTVKLVEQDKIIGGLNLKAIISGNSTDGVLVVYEEYKVYKIDLGVDLDTELGTYSIDVYIIGQETSIGEINFSVVERPTEAIDDQTDSNIFISLAGFGFFIIVGFGTGVVLFLLNQKLK